jgi:hypothetical protein
MFVATIHTIEPSHVTHADTRCPGVTVNVHMMCGSKGIVEHVTVEALKPLRAAGLV